MSATTASPLPASVSTDRPGVPFSRLVRVELRKMFDTRAGRWLMISIVVLSLIAAVSVIVVNNAILLVHQTLYLIRSEGYSHADAIVEATRNRIRPIFMSTLTSVGGMLPLVVFPGAGSEIYRGLGSVVVGGLSLSAVLTLAIIPPLLSVFAGVLEKSPPEQGAVKPAVAE